MGVEVTREQSEARQVLPYWHVWTWEKHSDLTWRPKKKTEKIKIPTGLWLQYEHPATSARRIVPVQGTADWYGLLPWLWHLVNWTPARLWIWLSWLAGDALIFGGWKGAEDSGYWAMRLVVALMVGYTYVMNGSRWHIDYLERTGFKCTGGVKAQSKGDALAKLAEVSR